MNSIDLIINGKSETLALKPLSPLLNIDLGKLKERYQTKANAISNQWVRDGVTLAELLTYDEIMNLNLAFKAQMEMNKTLDEKDKKAKTTQDKNLEMLNIIEQAKPIIKKLQDYAWAEVEDEYLIEKVKTVVNKGGLSQDILDFLQLPATDEKWLSQSSEVLQNVDKFFRTKREKATGHN